jgi:DNA-binding protein HU-beta
MNKAEFTEAVVSKVKPNDVASKAAANRIIDAVFEVIKDEVANGGEVAIANFGTFKAVDRAARVARNVSTGKTINVPAKKSPKFVPGKGFKQAVNQ